MTSLTRVDPVSFWSPGGEYHPETFFFMATPNDVTDAGRSGEFLAAQWGVPSGDYFLFWLSLMTSLTWVDPERGATGVSKQRPQYKQNPRVISLREQCAL